MLHARVILSAAVGFLALRVRQLHWNEEAD